MALWVVRAGRRGEQQETALKERVVCHGWNELPDYSKAADKDELRQMYVATYPAESEKQVQSGLGQVWRFAREIQKGDLVALPLKAESAFAFGTVTGEYRYKKLAPNVLHVRSVEWVNTVPRSAFPKEILFSMNSALTLFQVTRNDAEARVRKIVEASEAAVTAVAAPAAGPEAGSPDEEDAVDLEEAARDEILKYI
jgi:restriction system protein